MKWLLRITSFFIPLLLLLPSAATAIEDFYLSPPIVERPLYACATSVAVEGFVPGATIVLFNGRVPVATVVSSSSATGLTIHLNAGLNVGDVITATQAVNKMTSRHSDQVIVTDYFSEHKTLPRPAIDPTPLYVCGGAVGVRNLVPGGLLQVFGQQARRRDVEIGRVEGTGGAQWTEVNPKLRARQKVYAVETLCKKRGPASNSEPVVPFVGKVPTPTVDPVFEGQDVIVVRNVVNGAFIEVLKNGANIPVATSFTPGGSGQRIRIPKAGPKDTYRARQTLCQDSSGWSEPTTALACRDGGLPKPEFVACPKKISQDTVILRNIVDGATVSIYAGTELIGKGGGIRIKLGRSLMDKDELYAVQELGPCKSTSAKYCFNINGCLQPPETDGAIISFTSENSALLDAATEVTAVTSHTFQCGGWPSSRSGIILDITTNLSNLQILNMLVDSQSCFEDSAPCTSMCSYTILDRQLIEDSSGSFKRTYRLWVDTGGVTPKNIDAKVSAVGTKTIDTKQKRFRPVDAPPIVDLQTDKTDITGPGTVSITWKVMKGTAATLKKNGVEIWKLNSATDFDIALVTRDETVPVTSQFTLEASNPKGNAAVQKTVNVRTCSGLSSTASAKNWAVSYKVDACRTTPDTEFANSQQEAQQCADKKSSTNTCPSGQACCGAVCKGQTDFRSDPDNCGSCGKRCATNLSCIDGTCQSSTSCPSGQNPCGTACYGTGQYCPDPNKGIVCQIGQYLCGTTCYGTGQYCPDPNKGIVCQIGQYLCGTTCYGTGQYCPDPNKGIVCQTGQYLCGTTCYGTGQFCPDPNKGIVCQIGQNLCGTTCYGTGQYCADPNKGVVCKVGQTYSNGYCK